VCAWPGNKDRAGRKKYHLAARDTESVPSIPKKGKGRIEKTGLFFLEKEGSQFVRNGEGDTGDVSGEGGGGVAQGKRKMSETKVATSEKQAKGEKK